MIDRNDDRVARVERVISDAVCAAPEVAEEVLVCALLDSAALVAAKRHFLLADLQETLEEAFVAHLGTGGRRG